MLGSAAKESERVIPRIPLNRAGGSGDDCNCKFGGTLIGEASSAENLTALVLSAGLSMQTSLRNSPIS
jgi:hypothetical protein